MRIKRATLRIAWALRLWMINVFKKICKRLAIKLIIIRKKQFSKSDNIWNSSTWQTLVLGKRTRNSILISRNKLWSFKINLPDDDEFLIYPLNTVKGNFFSKITSHLPRQEHNTCQKRNVSFHLTCALRHRSKIQKENLYSGANVHHLSSCRFSIFSSFSLVSSLSLIFV